LQTSHPAIEVFRDAAANVPAYRTILSEQGLQPGQICTIEDFQRHVPVLDKQSTFGRFAIPDLCRGGTVPPLAGVLTSSGDSGRFSFGAYSPEEAARQTAETDEALDRFFQVRTRRTLLINALPMGVKVHTAACTLADTSVRADMVTALVKSFGAGFQQMILVGEAAFIKKVLELGLTQGVDWRGSLVHLILGEEPLAENARTYFGSILAADGADPRTGLIASSMGVAELGLNLFFETPHLIALRRALHESAGLRRRALGWDAPCAPMAFTYDPRRIFVEVLPRRRLVVTPLAPRTIPLVRYETGDAAMAPEPEVLSALFDATGLVGGIDPNMPVLFVFGRQGRSAEGTIPTPEEVKEALYSNPAIACAVTGNFRLPPQGQPPVLRAQLAEGASAGKATTERLVKLLSDRLGGGCAVRLEPYETFGDGMTLDYERKFHYTSRG